jgi:PAS domain-containing protein
VRGLGWIRFFGYVVVVSIFISPLLQADVTGLIFGTVTDPSGAVISAAHVTLSNPDTGLSRKTSTDSIGSYQFLAVPVGENYVVEVEASGFQKANQTGVKILVSKSYRADFHLVLGVVEQTASIQADESQVEMTNSQLGDVIESRKMTGLPLNGRSYIDLLGLQAGVVPITSTSALTSSLTGLGSAGNFSVNGQRETANSFLVNGGDVEEGRNNGASVTPTLDSIQEFRLLTNTFAAEYGRFSGAIVNVLTKSGTNEFHGSAFEFLRNSDLDSRNFFDQTRLPLDGVSVIDPHHLAFNKLPPPVHIEQIVADGKTYDLSSQGSGGVHLPPRVRDLTIDYTALSLVVPEKVRFRFKLEEQDADWREVVNQRRVEYSNLPPRHYRFRVMACNNSGVWNEAGATLDFVIPPAWYQTNGFRAMCAGAFLALVWAAYRLRIQHFRRQEKRLRDVIETMPTFAWTALADGYVDFVNRHWQEYTGLSTETTVGSGWEAVVHPADLKRHAEKWRASLATGKHSTMRSAIVGRRMCNIAGL